MITPQPFRRRLIDDMDGVSPRPQGWLFTGGLACHKGNASQTQASKQTGAQTQGAVADGIANQVNTGSQIVIQGSNPVTAYFAKKERGGTDAKGNPLSTAAEAPAVAQTIATINNGVTSEDVSAVINQLVAALKPAETTPAATTPPATDAPGTTSTSSKLQMAAAVVGIVGAGIYLFRKKS